MAESWFLRKQVEARILASTIAELFSPQEEKISSDELFSKLGIDLG